LQTNAIGKSDWPTLGEIKRSTPPREKATHKTAESSKANSEAGSLDADSIEPMESESKENNDQNVNSGNENKKLPTASSKKKKKKAGELCIWVRFAGI
jgi:hypothetical protein